MEPPRTNRLAVLYDTGPDQPREIDQRTALETAGNSRAGSIRLGENNDPAVGILELGVASARGVHGALRRPDAPSRQGGQRSPERTDSQPDDGIAPAPAMRRAVGPVKAQSHARGVDHEKLAPLLLDHRESHPLHPESP